MNPAAERDRGSTLIMVLVMMVIGALVITPVLTYTVTVYKAQSVERDKAESTSLSRGGIWVALEAGDELYESCGTEPIDSHLPGVTVQCAVLQEQLLRDNQFIPFEIAALQADLGGGAPAAVPAELADRLDPGDVYINPNTTTPPEDWNAWMGPTASQPTDGDWTWLSASDKVWIPQLPVRMASSDAADRDIDLPAGSFDPRYSECRVFFPGTFTDPVVLDSPTYFTSGVYYFEDTVTVMPGADVVVGGGEEIGCTFDFEAVANAFDVPNPLNINGLGGTFILGDQSRLIMHGGPTDDEIRFVINQRYVSSEEASVSASAGLSIVSVNGDHAVPNDTTWDAANLDPEVQHFSVEGVLSVPASRYDQQNDDETGLDYANDDPLALSGGYLPSVHTPKPVPPGPPINVQIDDYQFAGDGVVSVAWDPPVSDNGLPVTEYEAAVIVDGTATVCSPAPATVAGAPVQHECVVSGFNNDDRAVAEVRAKNVGGWSEWSATSSEVRIDLAGGGQSPTLGQATAPHNIELTEFDDGLLVQWAEPANFGGGSLSHYEVTVTTQTRLLAILPWDDHTTYTCSVEWEQAALLEAVDPSDPTRPHHDPTRPLECVVDEIDSSLITGVLGLLGSYRYDLSITAVTDTGSSQLASVAHSSQHAGVPKQSGNAPTPIVPVEVEGVRTPDPIIDIDLESADNEIRIVGYVATPQGHVRLRTDGAATGSTLVLDGGLVAANIIVEGTLPTGCDLLAEKVSDCSRIQFNNPVAQKQLKISSTSTGTGVRSYSEAVVQINRGGSIGINSWYVQ